MTDPCSQFDTLIARAARLTADETAILDAHLATCSACRDLARVLKPLDPDFKFTALSDTVAEDTTPTTAPDDSATKGRYRVTGEVGRGGIGRVLEALDQVLDRPVALKELFSTNVSLRRRFVREALITARLQHPSIVPIYDAGHLGDRSPFYAMKLVAGQPLDKSIAQANTLAKRLALLPRVLAVADAMAYAHSKRIIHRDLKPANVLVGAFGETIVIDWGLAKDLAVDVDDAPDAGAYRTAPTTHTVAGSVMGTPAFMAPEQAAGTAADERADVYALGAILYHVVSGVAPHDGATLEELTRRVIAGEVRPLTEREPDVPRDLAAIVTKAMALAPSDRYADAGGLAEDLRRFLTGQLVASHSYGMRELVRRWVKRHRAAVTVALAALAFVGVVGALSVVRVVRARELAEQERTTATQMLANLLEEQGRQALLARQPTRAAAYLSEAYTQNPEPGVGLRTLLADAMRSIEAQHISLDAHADGVSAAAFSPDGTRFVTAGADRLAKVWDGANVVITLAGHTDRLRSASFGTGRILTTSDDQTARLWDAHAGTLLATLEHPDHLRFAALAPDGTRVVTTGETGTAMLWDARTASVVASFDGHQGDVFAAAFSPDAALVVTAGEDRTAKVWDAHTAKLAHSLDGHTDAVISASFNPDGSQIVTASDDHTARLWSAQTGAVIATLTGHTGAVHVATFSPDGTRVVTASMDRSAKLWDARTGKLQVSLEGHTGPLLAAAFSADGSRIVTASDDRTTRLWDARSGNLLASFEGHRDDITAASFRPDGSQILTASADGTARLWNATAGTTHAVLATGTVEHGVFSADATKLVTTTEHDAKLWDVRTGKLLVSLDGHRSTITSADFDATAARVVTASADQSAKLWDANTGKLLFSLEHPFPITAARFSSDGARVITSISDQSTWIWNASTGALVAKFERTALEYPVRVTSEGTHILVASMYGTASIKSVDTSTSVAELAGNNNPIFAASFSEDGERVATVSIDRTVKIWNARTGTLVASLDGTTRYVFGAWFSADHRRLITVSENNDAKLWDATTGKLLVAYDGHTDGILGASFSPDGRVLTISTDRTAKLWDERTGKLLASLDGAHVDARFSTDGTHITLASRDGTLSIWDVHLERRAPKQIRSIVSARSPGTLSNGVLIPDAHTGNR